MKRCVKKRLAMFLATATLVTSAGLTSGLTVLAATVRSASVNSARSTVRVATEPDATDSNATPTPDPTATPTPDPTATPTPDPTATPTPDPTATPTPDPTATPTPGEMKPVDKENLSLAADTTIASVEADDGLKGLKVTELGEGEGAVPPSVTNSRTFANWLKETVLDVVQEVANSLAHVDFDRVDYSTLKKLDIKAEADSNGFIRVEMKDASKFAGKETVVLHKHGNTWESIPSKWIGNKLQFRMNKFSEVLIFAAEKKTSVATPSRGDSSSRGSNSSSGGGSSTTVSSSNVGTSTLVGSWKRDANGWWFQTTGGGYAKNRWGVLNGKWYFFGDDGYMKTGWVEYNGAWYYCNPDANNGTEGEMMIGWVSDNGRWFYLGRTGMMETGWVQVNGVWYYLNPISDGSKGAMAANTWIGNYYVGADGAWQQNATR